LEENKTMVQISSRIPVRFGVPWVFIQLRFDPVLTPSEHCIELYCIYPFV